MENVVLILLFAAVIGIAAIFAVMLRRNARDSAGAQAEAEAIRKKYEESTKMLLEETRRNYEAQIRTLEQRLDAQRSEMEQRMERHSLEVRRQSAMEFATLASDVLREQTATLQHTACTDIDTILAPLRSRLEEFRTAVTDTYVKENASREALSKQIETLARANSLIGEEARRLTLALKGDTRMQGRWGETVLRQLLEHAGLIKDVHFRLQTASVGGRGVGSEEGASYRPDLLLLLPGGHKLVVDSKTSMTDYLAYNEATDEVSAAEHLKRHVASVRNHIRELAAKQYHKHIEGAMEHTLMFMPNDASYLAALREDASLLEYAMKCNVAVVAPAHILSVVQLVSQLWRVENQNRNAEEIARAGGLLYDKVAAFFMEFEKIHKYIAQSDRAYQNALRVLTAGTQSVSARAERLRTLGAKVTQRVPEQFGATDEPSFFGQPIEPADITA